MMATNADNICPSAAWSMRTVYPVTMPRVSSRRTRDWTADTDRPAAEASCASVARPSANSWRTRMRSMSSSCSPASAMAALYLGAGVG